MPWEEFLLRCLKFLAVLAKRSTMSDTVGTDSSPIFPCLCSLYNRISRFDNVSKSNLILKNGGGATKWRWGLLRDRPPRDVIIGFQRQPPQVQPHCIYRRNESINSVDNLEALTRLASACRAISWCKPRILLDQPLIGHLGC